VSSIDRGRARVFFWAISLALVRTPTGRNLCHGGNEASSMTDTVRKNIDLVEAKTSRHRRSAPSGRDVVAVLGSSPLADVQFDRFTIKPKVRDIKL
jgi:hypothetical protein